MVAMNWLYNLCSGWMISINVAPYNDSKMGPDRKVLYLGFWFNWLRGLVLWLRFNKYFYYLVLTCLFMVLLYCNCDSYNVYNCWVVGFLPGPIGLVLLCVFGPSLFTILAAPNLYFSLSNLLISPWFWVFSIINLLLFCKLIYVYHGFNIYISL